MPHSGITWPARATSSCRYSRRGEKPEGDVCQCCSTPCRACSTLYMLRPLFGSSPRVLHQCSLCRSANAALCAAPSYPLPAVAVTVAVAVVDGGAPACSVCIRTVARQQGAARGAQDAAAVKVRAPQDAVPALGAKDRSVPLTFLSCLLARPPCPRLADLELCTRLPLLLLAVVGARLVENLHDRRLPFGLLQSLKYKGQCARWVSGGDMLPSSHE
mmetsp:Transcript_21218/g.82332  ORF Transcript_21218/g.82332 Transcript_21218/m.82332 type:complete len:216 (-) Transcript_21218:136-783(-)